MESMDVGIVLEEAGDANWRANTISQLYVEYFINCHTSRCIRLMIIIVLLLQTMGRWEGWGVDNLC